jgi:hypothetical protein
MMLHRYKSTNTEGKGNMMQYMRKIDDDLDFDCRVISNGVVANAIILALWTVKWWWRYLKLSATVLIRLAIAQLYYKQETMFQI